MTIHIRRTSGRLSKATRWLTTAALLLGAAATVTGSVGGDASDGIPEAQLGEPVPVTIVDPSNADSTTTADDGHVWQPSTVTWPEPSLARAAVDGTARNVVGTPISLAATDPIGAVDVQVYDRSVTVSSGVDGVLVRLDATSAEGQVQLGLDYAAFAGAYGGGWASRLRLVALNDCVDTTAPVCRTGTPVESTNDLVSNRVSATVPASGVYALTAAAGSDAGDYKATDLSAAGSWTQGGSSGGFSYTYPMRTPPASGPIPSLGLSYSSQSHDGRTSGSNNQASWVGDGWTYEPGYVERSYTTCSVDQDGGNNGDKKTADKCWDGDSNTITLSLNGTNTALVRDDTTGAWRAAGDSDWRIEKLGSSATSSTATTEYWRVTTTDGIQYTFGSSANSRWTVPVFGNQAGEACHATAFADSRCDQAYRWQVQKVVDVHGNQVNYTYGTETGHYGAGGDANKRVSYIRGGYVSRIDYGLRADDSSVTPTARIAFGVVDRCLNDCGTVDAPNTANWPDTPWDLDCKTAPCTDQTSPAFFATKRLATVTTQVANGTGFRDVDQWTLTHEFKDYGDSSQVVMWLGSVQHTGLAGGNIALPPTTFAGVSMPNRVETGTGIPAIWRSRITSITTETGGVIGVKYSDPDCASGDLPSADESNTRLCYPVWWTPDGYWTAKKDWFRKYVVTSISEHDQTANTPSKLTSYDYSTAGGGTSVLWAWDDGEFTQDDHRTYGEWRGYAQVTTKVGDPTQGSTLNTRTSYYRGMDGQRLPSGTRSVSLTDSEGHAVVDHEALAGSVFETVQLNGTTIDSASVSKYWTKKTATRAYDGGSLKAWMTGESEKTSRKLLTGTTWQRTKTVTSYDSHGRAVTVDDQGDITTTSDDLCTRTEYGLNTAAWITEAKVRAEKVSVNCATTPSRPSNVVSDVRTFYDGSDTFGTIGSRGLPTKVQTLDSWSGGPVYKVTSATTYDKLGRPLANTDALGRTTTTAYTPTGAGPATSTVVTNPLGHAVTTTLDPAWGSTTATVDANARRTDSTFDALGRATAVWLPGQSKAAGKAPHYKFSYTVSNTAPSMVTSQKLGPNLTYITTVALYDSLLRQIETQTDTPIGGRLVSETGYNSRGEKAYTSGPNYDDTSTPNGQLVRVEPGADHARTVYAYDDLGRVTTEAFWSKNVHRWDTTTVYGGSDQGFLTTVTPPSGGIKTATLSNARGQAIEKRQYRADGSYAPITYTFTPDNKPATVVDSVGNTWSYGYDLRGNKTRATDPDTGVTLFGYDVAGQQTSTTDARGVTVSTVYDKLGRVSSTWKGVPDTGTKLSDYTYDTLTGGLGLLTASKSYVDGALAVTNRIGKYDVAGRPTQHYTEIAAVPGLEKLAGSYLDVTVYTVDGQPKTTSFSDYGGLGFESVTNAFNATGQPTRMLGHNAVSDQTYVDAASYTAYGELAQRTLAGVSGRHVYQTNTYEDGTRRRQSLTLSQDGSSTTQIASLSYGYDDTGNVTSIADSGGLAGGAERQCFAYDDLRQMNEAWAQAGTGDCAAQPSKDVMGGPAPYWSSYTHDVTGNRTSETKHTVNEDVANTYTYPQAGDPGAHIVSSVVHGISTDTYTPDAVGNLAERHVAGQSETLSWDARGKLESIQDTKGATRMVYDADGNRVARIDANGDATVFAAQTEVTYTEATDAVTAVRSYTQNGEVIATRSTAYGLVWSCGDHHGTATWTVAAIAMTVTVRRQDPYGNARGPVVTWNAGQRGFVNGVNDPTGLVNIGARSYDPKLGKFISRDPIADFTDPQQINGYTYSNANPVTYSDPTGKRRCENEDCPQWDDKRPNDDGDSSGVGSGDNPDDGPSGGQLGIYQAAWCDLHGVVNCLRAYSIMKKAVNKANELLGEQGCKRRGVVAAECEARRNAFRHSYWIGLMTVNGFTYDASITLGVAHELDGDKASQLWGTHDSDVDLHNNNVGARMGVDIRGWATGLFGINLSPGNSEEELQSTLLGMALGNGCNGDYGCLDLTGQH